MARIRTIKPEFPQSESLGRISRDARLLFVMLWTICDDYGKTRAASRMLASLLFPYDEDAPELIDDWLAELEEQNCIVRYIVEGTTYLQICKWLNHQKVDRPSPSKFPEFDESSRMIASPRGKSSVDLDLDLGSGPGPGSGPKDQGPKAFASSGQAKSPKKFEKQSLAKKEPSKTSATWEAYSAAYLQRYGAAPVTNPKVNGILSKLIDRLGAEEAPAVARFYLTHNQRYYVQCRHSVDCLLKDAEGLRTEWITGRQVTATQANDMDRRTQQGQMWDRLIAESEQQQHEENPR